MSIKFSNKAVFVMNLEKLIKYRKKREQKKIYLALIDYFQTLPAFTVIFLKRYDFIFF